MRRRTCTPYLILAALVTMSCEVHASRLYADNTDCHVPVRMNVVWGSANSQDGDLHWRESGWFTVEAGEITRVSDVFPQRYFYFYAETLGGEYRSGGGSYDGQEIRLKDGREVFMFRQEANWLFNNTVKLSCPSDTRWVRRFLLHNTCHVPIDVGIHYLSTRGVWDHHSFEMAPGAARYVSGRDGFLASHNTVWYMYAYGLDEGEPIAWCGSGDPGDIVELVRGVPVRFQHHKSKGQNNATRLVCRKHVRKPVQGFHDRLGTTTRDSRGYGDGPEMIAVAGDLWRGIISFSLSKHEITFDDWDLCVQHGGCNGYEPDDEGWGRGRRPVINVSMRDAMSYVRWLSRTALYEYRLPRHSEWLYATVATIKTPEHFSTPAICDWENIDSCANGSGRKTKPVGSHLPNGYGFFDLIGNVDEWFLDGSRGNSNLNTVRTALKPGDDGPFRDIREGRPRNPVDWDEGRFHDVGFRVRTRLRTVRNGSEPVMCLN